MSIDSYTSNCEVGLSGLARSLRDAGLVLMPADPAVNVPAFEEGFGYLELLLQSPTARGLIARGLARLTVGREQFVEPLAGLVVFPLEIPRRLAGGKFVAVTLLAEGVESETLDILAGRAGLDARSVRQVLWLSDPWERRRLGRLQRIVAALARAEWERIAGEQSGANLSTAMEELHLLHSLADAMAHGDSTIEFVRRTLAEARQTIGCRWTAMSVDDATALMLGIEPGTVLMDGSDDAEIASAALQSASSLTQASLVGDNIVVAPLGREGAQFGAFAAGERTSGDQAMSGFERALVGTAAGNLSVFIEKSRLERDRDRIFFGALSALVSAIDAKDPYTRGHSQRVALLAKQIASKAGLPDAEVTNIFLAGLVHDVGKIAVPESVLRKQGRLTDEEFAVVKQHPERGYNILRDIPNSQTILDGVLHHHERFDGCGYPHRLAGTEIPRVARIIAIADTFDAMSSTRTYRSALSRQEILAEMRRLAGRQFDPEYLAHFFTIDLKAYDALAEHDAVASSPSGDASSLDMLGQEGQETHEGAPKPISFEGLMRRDARKAA
ncbi:MAG: Cyclic di-GMP phosphodiesterase response regulator RpfG [Planctomycetota bacterium]